MPSGVPVPRLVKREFFDLVCGGMATTHASVKLRVAPRTGGIWWRQAGGVRLRKGPGCGGLANPGDLARPGGTGHRVSFEERVEIDRGLHGGLNHSQIAEKIGRDRSVVWREVKRNSLHDGDYHALMAHAFATEKARRPKPFKLKDNPLCKTIQTWMGDGWSPKLIADVLARDYPDDKLMTVSHETIYNCLYVQTRGSLRADLHNCLSTKRSARSPAAQLAAPACIRPVRCLPSAIARPRPRIGLCPGTGRAI